jgi:hypothetical protein
LLQRRASLVSGSQDHIGVHRPWVRSHFTGNTCVGGSGWQLLPGNGQQRVILLMTISHLEIPAPRHPQQQQDSQSCKLAPYVDDTHKTPHCRDGL